MEELLAWFARGIMTRFDGVLVPFTSWFTLGVLGGGVVELISLLAEEGLSLLVLRLLG